MTDPVLKVRSLSVDYEVGDQTYHALTDVSLELRAGEALGVIGESGSGKSTLCSAINGLLPSGGRISGGSISYDDAELLTLDRDQLRRLRGADIGTVFQDPLTSLNPVFSIGTQMVDAQRSHEQTNGASTATQKRVSLDGLRRVGIDDPDVRINQFPHEFSGGMRQRALIATALQLSPRVLLADEPTSALDVTTQAQILGLLAQIRDHTDAALLLVSHDFSAISQLCDRVIVLYAGRIVEEASLETLFTRPRHPYTVALRAAVRSADQRGRPLTTIPGQVPNLSQPHVGCTFADRCSFVEDICRTVEPPLLQIGGDAVRCHLYDPRRDDVTDPADVSLIKRTPTRRSDPAITVIEPTMQAGAPQSPNLDPVVEVQGLSVHYGGRRRLGRTPSAPVRAVDGVSLSVQRGEILGLVGESGSGKSTLAEAMLGLVRPTNGTAVFDGTDIAAMSRRQLKAMRARAQIIFQDPHASLSPRMSVRRLLSEPYEIHRTPLSDRRTADELLTIVGLRSDLADKLPRQLSGGQARRVGIARALALDPELIVADEPTAGLDTSVAAGIVNQMRTLSDQLGVGFLVVTHDLNLMTQFADRVAVMYLGRIVEVGTVDSVLEKPAHPYTRALLTLASASSSVRGAPVADLVPGDVPSPRNPPSGCHFHPRCPFAVDLCTGVYPSQEVVENAHEVSCHRWRDVTTLAHDPH